jgi:hypothetical protein
VLQIRRLGAGNGCTGYTSFGGGFVLVAHGAGRALQAPLPDDERACAFDHGSGCVGKYLLLPSLRRQADPGFNASGSKRPQHWGGPDI